MGKHFSRSLRVLLLSCSVFQLIHIPGDLCSYFMFPLPLATFLSRPATYFLPHPLSGSPHTSRTLPLLFLFRLLLLVPFTIHPPLVPSSPFVAPAFSHTLLFLISTCVLLRFSPVSLYLPLLFKLPSTSLLITAQPAPSSFPVSLFSFPFSHLSRLRFYLGAFVHSSFHPPTTCIMIFIVRSSLHLAVYSRTLAPSPLFPFSFFVFYFPLLSPPPIPLFLPLFSSLSPRFPRTFFEKTAFFFLHLEFLADNRIQNGAPRMGLREWGSENGAPRMGLREWGSENGAPREKIWDL